MLYRFRSKASGDVLMLEPQGDELLRALGREPAGAGMHHGRNTRNSQPRM